MEDSDYNDSTIGSATPLAGREVTSPATVTSPEKQDGILRDKEDIDNKEDVIEYVPKRMSKLSDQELQDNIEPKMPSANCSQSCSRCLYSTIIGVVTLSLVMTTIVHIFAWYQDDINSLPNDEIKINWFEETRREAWNKTKLLMIVDCTFWVWTVVYYVQLFWLFYGMVLTCRRTKEGYLYERAQTMPVTIYLIFLLSLAGSVLWYFLWGHFGYVQWAALALGVTALVTHVCLAVVISAFVSSITDLREMGKTWDLIWNQLFTQNGIAGMAAWQSVVTMYNVTALLVPVIQDKGDTETNSCSIGLGMIMLYILIWTIVDLFFSRRTLYYIFTPYIIAIIAFASAFARNLKSLEGDIHEYPSLVVSAIFLALTALFLVVKIIVVAVKGRYSSDDKAEVRSLHDDNVYVMQ